MLPVPSRSIFTKTLKRSSSARLFQVLAKDSRCATARRIRSLQPSNGDILANSAYQFLGRGDIIQMVGLNYGARTERIIRIRRIHAVGGSRSQSSALGNHAARSGVQAAGRKGESGEA